MEVGEGQAVGLAVSAWEGTQAATAAPMMNNKGNRAEYFRRCTTAFLNRL
jgi:hypothetical protein